MLQTDRKNAFVFPELATNVVLEKFVVTSVNHLALIASEQVSSVSPPTRTILIKSPHMLVAELALVLRLKMARLFSQLHLIV